MKYLLPGALALLATFDQADAFEVYPNPYAHGKIEGLPVDVFKKVKEYDATNVMLRSIHEMMISIFL